MVKIEAMALSPRVTVSPNDSQAAGRGRQRLKLAAIGYVHARHGVDTDADVCRGARKFLRQMAFEFVGTLPGALLKSRRFDPSAGNDEMLTLAAIAYASSRHGVDADVGMIREGLALLCQSSIDFVESLPKEDNAPKRSPDLHQITNGAHP